MTTSMPKKLRKRLSAKVDKKVVAKAPKKKNMPRKNSVASKEREEDVAKVVTQRNTRSKALVSNTIAGEADKVATATALVPVQPNYERTALPRRLLKRRKMTEDIEGMPEKKKRKAVRNDDVEEETVQELLTL